jgi:hypothetical protein
VPATARSVEKLTVEEDHRLDRSPSREDELDDVDALGRAVIQWSNGTSTRR